MASKCIIVGHCPAELAALFGYNPVVEADLDHPAAQLEELLHRSDQYEALVDKNYNRLLEVGTWDHRIEEMLRSLNAAGYGPSWAPSQRPSD